MHVTLLRNYIHATIGHLTESTSTPRRWQTFEKSPPALQKCAEIYSESHQKSFKPSPTRIGRVLCNLHHLNIVLPFQSLPPAAGGFPKNVQKFVRRVTRSRLSHRRPKSDEYYATYTIRISYFRSGPRRRRRRRPPADFQKMSRNLFGESPEVA